MDELRDLFKKKSEPIKVFIATETTTDPFYKTKTRAELNPIPIRAIVSSVAPEKIKWKFYGTEVTDAKELMIESNNLGLIRMSHKIEINGVDYESYKKNTIQFAIQEVDDNYARIVLWRSP